MNLLHFVCTLPMVGGLIVSVIPRSNLRVIKSIGLVISQVTFLLSLLLWYNFDPNYLGYQWYSHLLWIPFWNFQVWFGLDGLSIYFILLTTFLVPICILASWNSIKNNVREFLVLFLILESFVLLSFSILDLLLFYFFFESILVPMFLIIGIYGSRERKILAAYKFFLYTLAGSALMLLSIVVLYIIYGTTSLELLLTFKIPMSLQILAFVSFFVSFAVKIPVLPVHLWLPEAHVEAPTAGSIILAGVLLKLGGYGLLRFSIPLFPEASEYLTPVIYTISLISIVYASLTTIRQTDLKKIIAYSSVAHMNLVVLGIFSNQVTGVAGSVLLMLSHGFVSSGLFLCIGILYDRHHTRLLPYYGGLASLMPLYSTFFVLLSLANISVPLSSSFVGELLVFLSMFYKGFFSCIVAGSSVILSAVYSMWLCNRLLFGRIRRQFLLPYLDISVRELSLLSLFLGLILFMGIYADFFLLDLQNTTSVYLSLID